MKKMKSMPADETSAVGAPGENPPIVAAGGEREGYILFHCRRCKGPLYFPTGPEAKHRSTTVCCRKCGAQTKLPLKNKWIYVTIGVVIFVAAWVVVILTVMKDEDFLP